MESEAQKPTQKINKLAKYKLFFQSVENLKPRGGFKPPRTSRNNSSSNYNNNDDDEDGNSSNNDNNNNDNSNNINDTNNNNINKNNNNNKDKDKDNNNNNKDSNKNSTNNDINNSNEDKNSINNSNSNNENKISNSRYSSGFFSTGELSDEFEVKDVKGSNDVFIGNEDSDKNYSIDKPFGESTENKSNLEEATDENTISKNDSNNFSNIKPKPYSSDDHSMQECNQDAINLSNDFTDNYQAKEEKNLVLRYTDDTSAIKESDKTEKGDDEEGYEDNEKEDKSEEDDDEDDEDEWGFYCNTNQNSKADNSSHEDRNVNERPTTSFGHLEDLPEEHGSMDITTPHFERVKTTFAFGDSLDDELQAIAYNPLQRQSFDVSAEERCKTSMGHLRSLGDNTSLEYNTSDDERNRGQHGDGTVSLGKYNLSQDDMQSLIEDETLSSNDDLTGANELKRISENEHNMNQREDSSAAKMNDEQKNAIEEHVDRAVHSRCGDHVKPDTTWCWSSDEDEGEDSSPVKERERTQVHSAIDDSNRESEDEDANQEDSPTKPTPPFVQESPTVNEPIDDDDDDEVFETSPYTTNNQVEENYSSGDDSDEAPSDKPNSAPLHPNRKRMISISKPAKRKVSRYDSIESFKTLGTLQPDIDLCGDTQRKASTATANPYTSMMRTVVVDTSGDEETKEVDEGKEMEESTSKEQNGQDGNKWRRGGESFQQLVDVVEYAEQQGSVLEMFLWTPLLLMIFYIIFVENGKIFLGSLTEDTS